MTVKIHYEEGKEEVLMGPLVIKDGEQALISDAKCTPTLQRSSESDAGSTSRGHGFTMPPGSQRSPRCDLAASGPWAQFDRGTEVIRQSGTCKTVSERIISSSL